VEPIPDYTSSVGEELKALAASGVLTPDTAQMQVAAKLDHILKCFRDTKPAKKTSALGWLFPAVAASRGKSADFMCMAASVAARPC